MNDIKRRLVLEPKPDEEFVLYDDLSKATTNVKVFYRRNGNLAVAFEAPSQIQIIRKRRSAERGNKETD